MKSKHIVYASSEECIDRRQPRLWFCELTSLHTFTIQRNPGCKELAAEGNDVGRRNARRMWEWVRCYALCRKGRATGVTEFDRARISIATIVGLAP